MYENDVPQRAYTVCVYTHILTHLHRPLRERGLISEASGVKTRIYTAEG